MKVHVIYHRLELDCRLGAYDYARFEGYIQLPRRAAHVARAHQQRHRDAFAELDRDFTQVTGLPSVGDDSALVREFLEQRFFDPAVDDYCEYGAWLDQRTTCAKCLPRPIPSPGRATPSAGTRCSAIPATSSTASSGWPSTSPRKAAGAGPPTSPSSCSSISSRCPRWS
ncbi:MAG: hypothetical protein R6X02_32035 [Enhygromyxa sp.]